MVAQLATYRPISTPSSTTAPITPVSFRAVTLKLSPLRPLAASRLVSPQTKRSYLRESYECNTLRKEILTPRSPTCGSCGRSALGLGSCVRCRSCGYDQLLPSSSPSPAARVPERPTLEGLEAKWSAVWERDGIYRFDRSRPARAGLLDRHAAADRERLAARRPRLLLHPHRRGRPLPADARAGGLLPDGLGRQRPADRAPRAEPLRRALRPVGAPTTPHFQPPCRAVREGARVGLAPELRRAVPAPDRERRAGLRGAVAHARAVGRLVDDLHDDRPRWPSAISQRSFLGLLARGAAYQLEAPTLWDVDFQTAVAQAELEDRERPGAMHRVRFGAGRRRRAEALIETTRPELIPACVALLAHPDDERHARPRRRRGADAAVRHARAGADAPAGRAREGHGPGDGVHVRRPDRRDLVARAGPARPLGARRPTGASPRSRGAAPGWESDDLERARASYGELAGRTINQARKRIVELLAESGDLIGEPQPVTRAVKFFEKGDRPVEIVTSRQWFIRTIEHRDELIARGRELQLASALHARALRGLGERPERRLVHQPPALLRRAVPGVVSDRRRAAT